MKRTIIISFIITNCFILNAQTFTQEAKTSGGGYYHQINGSMQFTIGEPLTETYTNSSAKLYQGFEQGSYSIVSVTELPMLTDLDVNLYPNPSTGIFNLNIESTETSTFKIDVINALGKSIIYKEITTKNIELIDLSGFASSIYYVSITNAGKNYLKTFKIIKQ
ncbi:MAG: T9SS type A sorting domain-containing protein [Bacteroidetes bacterium]|nr:T9SS type A sorting domain-containing protein [Bacteroidota bacterium]